MVRDDARRSRSWPARLALALVPLTLLILALELGLWMFGLGAAEDQAAPSRGFDPQTAYLFPEGDGWRTHFYGSPEQETLIPPKGEARRVLLVGGSNTQVFPDQYLAELLQRQSPWGPGYEVFNLGRAGYGSGRVAILLEQALVIEPDVVVIYSGHNEFVERGLALELQRRAGGLTGTQDMGLGTLRVFRQLEQALRESGVGPADDVDPTSEVPDYDVTLAVYAAYRANIARMCDSALAAGADVVLCTVVSNDFSAPYLAGSSAATSEEHAARAQVLRRKAVGQIPESCRVDGSQAMRLNMPCWSRRATGTATVPTRVAELPVLRPLSGALARAPATPAEHEHDASMAGHHWPPRAGWNGKVEAVLQTMEQVSARSFSEGQRLALTRARGLLRQALELQPEHAGTLFQLGLVSWLLGEDDEAARELLRRAQVADWAPHSGNDLSNDVLRSVASERPAVRLLDAARLFAEDSPGGVVGFEVMMDACHLQPGARRVLMADLVPAIVARWQR